MVPSIRGCEEAVFHSVGPKSWHAARSVEQLADDAVAQSIETARYLRKMEFAEARAVMDGADN
jgi:hypothetical protein